MMAGNKAQADYRLPDPSNDFPFNGDRALHVGEKDGHVQFGFLRAGRVPERSTPKGQVICFRLALEILGVP